jgi:hypothetical protein
LFKLAIEVDAPEFQSSEVPLELNRSFSAITARAYGRLLVGNLFGAPTEIDETSTAPKTAI